MTGPTEKEAPVPESAATEDMSGPRQDSERMLYALAEQRPSEKHSEGPQLGWVWPDMVKWLQSGDGLGVVNLHRTQEHPDMVPVFLQSARPAREQELANCLRELQAMVWGECPSLLNEDSGGNGELDCRINAALSSTASKEGK